MWSQWSQTLPQQVIMHTLLLVSRASRLQWKGQAQTHTLLCRGRRIRSQIVRVSSNGRNRNRRLVPPVLTLAPPLQNPPPQTTDAHNNWQLTQSFVTGSDLVPGQYMVCYAEAASSGDAEGDFTSQRAVTVVAPSVTSFQADNAAPSTVAAGIDATLSVDGPDGDFVALIPSGSVHCAGTCTTMKFMNHTQCLHRHHLTKS